MNHSHVTALSRPEVKRGLTDVRLGSGVVSAHKRPSLLKRKDKGGSRVNVGGVSRPQHSH